MVNVRCRTNLDNMEKEIWPTEMTCRPQKGDYVESKSGRILTIVGITHKMGNHILGEVRHPYIEIELNKLTIL